MKPTAKRMNSYWKFLLSQRFNVADRSEWNRFANCSATILLGVSLIVQVSAQQIPGIPEPGLVMYGSVVNEHNSANTRMTFGTLRWSVKPVGGFPITLNVDLANLNNELSYVVKVPFETLLTGFSATANTLRLTASPTEYERSAVVNNQVATITQASLSSFAFSGAERGSIQRVDLKVSFNDDTDGDGLSDQWEIARFGNLNSGASDDPDGDGFSNAQEFSAGTDPNDVNSRPSGNALPTISSITDQSTTVDTATGAISFQIGDAETGVGDLTVTGTSSNTTLVPSSNIAFSGTPENRTVTVTPASGQSGEATIKVRVTDAGGLFAERSFVFTVLRVNSAPSFTKGASQSVAENAVAQTVSNWATSISAGSAEESGQTLTFQVSNNNTALFASQPSISSSGNLAYTPATAASGSATVTVVLKDDGGTANGGVDTSGAQTFTITVTPPGNTVPTITALADQLILDGGATDLVFTVGDSETASDQLTVTGTSSNTTLLPNSNITFSGSAENRTVTVTPTSGQTGETTIKVRVADAGGLFAETSFVITVSRVNSAPSFTKGADQSVAQNAGAQTVSNWATSISAGAAEESGQTLSFQVSNNNTSLFASQPSISSSGTLTYTPATDSNGSATVTVVLKDDGGMANGGVDTSAAQTFTITVAPPGNSIPTISDVGDQVIWDGGATEIAFTVGDLETASDQLTVTASSSNTEVIPSANLTVTGAGADRKLVITPVAAKEGVTEVTLQVTDADDAQAEDKLIVTVTKRRLYLSGTSGSAGTTVTLSVEIDAQGNEQAVGFSLTYDPAVIVVTKFTDQSGLSSVLLPNLSAAESGKVGVAWSLVTGAIPAGTRSLITVELTIASGASGGSYTIEIGDDPAVAAVSDTNTTVVDTAFQAGTITVSTGFEGDVAGRPNGDQKLVINDWVQVGRFVVGLDQIGSASEFQRTDTAPRVVEGSLVLGDNKIIINDWVQAGRYVVGLDAKTGAGGPVGTFATQSLNRNQTILLQADLSTRVRGRVRREGNEVAVGVNLESEGNVAAVGFSFWFDSSQWDYQGASLSGDSEGAVLVLNERWIESGQVGMLIAKMPGSVFTQGQLELIEIRFGLRDSAKESGLGFRFGDMPVEKAVADVTANHVSTVFTMEGDQVRAFQITAMRMEGGVFEFEVITKAGEPVSVEVSENLIDWRESWQGNVPESGRLKFTDEIYEGNKQQFYRVREQGQKKVLSKQ